MADNFWDMFILIQLIEYILLFAAPAVSVGEILTSNSGMAFVKECPKNLTGVQEASERLNCGEDKYGNSRYLCLPNTEKTSLVEFCYNGTMGMHEKGNCLEAWHGSLVLKDCRQFALGCPDLYFRSTEFYKYPACQTIDIKRQCYMLDTSCPSCEISCGDNIEEEYCSVAVWQALFCLAFVVICIPVIYKLIKFVKGKQTYLSIPEDKATETLPKIPTGIYFVERIKRGIQDSRTKIDRSHWQYHTYPVPHAAERDLYRTTFTHNFSRKNNDCFPEECPDSCTDLLHYV